MALVKCPECGRQISDKAVACPGCGFPIEEKAEKKTETDLIADKLYAQYPGKMVDAIRELRLATGLDLKTARDMMYIRYKGATPKELEDRQKAINKEKRRQASEDLQYSLEALSNAFGSGSAKPKKGVSYESKKLSVGRAAVGYGLAGPAGAVLGGLSSKKRQAVDPETGKKLSKREVKKRMK